MIYYKHIVKLGVLLMLVLNKKAKLILLAVGFVVMAAGGALVERFEKDAFIMETVASNESVPYHSDADMVINDKININSADAVALEKLNGIGDALAGRIIKYREDNGPFVTIEEIMHVAGISEKKFQDIKDNICIE